MKAVTANERGQSTIEFMLTITLMMGFILFFMQLAFVFGFASYAHYATFMAARALLSAGPDGADAQSRARDVIVATLKQGDNQSGADRFSFIAQGSGTGDPLGFQDQPPTQYVPGDRTSSWMQGVRYRFRSRLFLIPLGGNAAGSGSSANSVTLNAESWLGQEPGTQECLTYLKKVGTGTGVYFDNGC